VYSEVVYYTGTAHHLCVCVCVLAHMCRYVHGVLYVLDVRTNGGAISYTHTY